MKRETGRRCLQTLIFTFPMHLHISHSLLIELLRHCFSIELGFYMFVCIHVKVQDQVLLLRHLNDVAIISVVVHLHA